MRTCHEMRYDFLLTFSRINVTKWQICRFSGFSYMHGSTFYYRLHFRGGRRLCISAVCMLQTFIRNIMVCKVAKEAALLLKFICLRMMKEPSLKSQAIFSICVNFFFTTTALIIQNSTNLHLYIYVYITSQPKIPYIVYTFTGRGILRNSLKVFLPIPN